MAIPASREARQFYRSAHERFEDGRYLARNGRTTGAVYLGGYGVECIFKALILASLPNDAQRGDMVTSFRGAKGHDLEWLKQLYTRLAGIAVPKDLTPFFSRVSTWSNRFRYSPKTIKQREADLFLQAVAKVLEWADGRL